jgi:Ornithine decarboxylase antizyme
MRSSTPAKNLQKARREGIAYTITEECERLFCETLKAVFLGERSGESDSLVVGTQHITKYDGRKTTERVFLDDRRFASISPDSSVYDDIGSHHLVEKFIEVYDYIGGAKFRGFIANNAHNELAIFVFFDQGVIGCDLKPG